MEKNVANRDTTVVEMFGLSYEQTVLLFSAQKAIVCNDIKHTKNQKQSQIKQTWVDEWEKGVLVYLDSIKPGTVFHTAETINKAFVEELGADDNNHTWYYIAVLELLSFAPYTALGGQNDKEYNNCKFDEKIALAWIKGSVSEHGCISEEKVDRLQDVYNKSLAQISGRRERIATKALTIIAVAAAGAALAAIGAGPIAVALFGSAFEGLSGAALVSACLALVGGGAVAMGGAGMMGGIAIIAGGGALLGLAGGGAAVGIGSLLIEASPEFALTQSAKLETILKEVVLNAQQDVVTAQRIISTYKEQIIELSKEITEMELDLNSNKKVIKNLKKSIDYLKKACNSMGVFESAYEEGLAVQNEQKE